MKKTETLRVVIVGHGKVGAALKSALSAKGVRVTLRRARDPLPQRPFAADILVLSVRDGQLGPLAERIAAARLVGPRTAVVHCAGALGPEVLSALRPFAAGVAQMHPMISFASPRFVPSLLRGQVHVDGDPKAVRAARRLARILGMSPRTITGLDRIAYHAAAGLVANGAAALSASGAALLSSAGVDARTAVAMLGPLLRSVADNVERLGLPEALTGPVRRGDAGGVERHLIAIRERAPDLVPLYCALVSAQLPLARALGDAPPTAWEAMERVVLSARGESKEGRAGSPARRRLP